MRSLSKCPVAVGTRMVVATMLTCILAGCGGSSGSDSLVLGQGGIAPVEGAVDVGGSLGGPQGPLGPGSGTPTTIPFNSGGDVNGLNQQGLAALRGGEFADFVRARDIFRQSAGAIGAITNKNDADTARFFYALTRVAAIASELPSDGSDNGLNSVGDFLDSLGFAPAPRNRYKSLVAPATFRGSVTGEDARKFLAGRVRSELEGAIADLSQVSENFNVTWTRKKDGPGLPGTAGELTVESDFGDVLTFRSTFRMALGSILVLGTYDLGGSVSNVLNSTNRSMQTILGANPNALTVIDASLLNPAQAAFSAGISDGITASEFMQSETDPQNNDLITIVETPAQTVSQYRSDAATWRNALTQTVTVRSSGGQSTATLSLQNYFDGGPEANLRTQMPPFIGNSVGGRFPGSPFGAVYGGYVPGSLSDPNRDINVNNVPDTFE